MDNSPPNLGGTDPDRGRIQVDAAHSQDERAWATPTAALYAVAVGGVALATAAIFAQDAASRLLIGIGAVALLGLAVLGFRQRPRLTAVTGGRPHLVVRGLGGADEYFPEQIDRIRLIDYRRLGRRHAMLEIDVRAGDTERLLVFGRWDLGADPRTVYDTLESSGFVPSN